MHPGVQQRSVNILQLHLPCSAALSQLLLDFGVDVLIDVGEVKVVLDTHGRKSGQEPLAYPGLTLSSQDAKSEASCTELLKELGFVKLCTEDGGE